MPKKQHFSRMRTLYRIQLQSLQEQTNAAHVQHPLQKAVYQVQGIHCASCVAFIERRFHQCEGVQKVEVDALTGKVELHGTLLPGRQHLQQTIQANGYTLCAWQEIPGSRPKTEQRNTLRDYTEMGALVVLLFGLYQLFSRLHLIPTTIGVSQDMSYGVIFVIGLVASVSSCMAATGGLIVAMAASASERLAAANRFHRVQPAVFFNLGRIVSYTVFGAFIGALGTVFTLSAQLNGAVIILASLLMMLLGCQLLKLFPWVRKLQPKMPAFLSQKIYDAGGTPSIGVSFLVGAATFFLPCGFTQALQLYVLSRGNALTGAVTMLIFSLGTLPALLSLSTFSSLITGMVQRYVLKFAGVLVLLLGVMSIGNGLALTGISLSPPASLASVQNGSSQTRTVPIINGKQVVTMKVVGYEYIPSTFTIVQGVPVEWHVDGSQAQECARVLTVPDLGLTEALPPQGSKTIAFLPQKAGTFHFTCPAAMTTPGARFTVLPNTHPSSVTALTSSLATAKTSSCFPQQGYCSRKALTVTPPLESKTSALRWMVKKGVSVRRTIL